MVAKKDLANAVRRRRALRDFMAKHDLKPAVWARKAGLKNPNSLYNFLGGRSNSLASKTLEVLARAVGVTVDDLIGDVLSPARVRGVAEAGQPVSEAQVNRIENGRGGNNVTDNVPAPRGKLTDSWSPEIFSRVGEVAIAFAQLEWALFVAAKRVDGSMKLAKFAKVHQTKRFNELCEMITEKSSGNPTLLALVHEAKLLAKRRHDLIHGVWAEANGEKVLFRVPRKGEFYHVTISAAEFGALAKSIRRTRNGLLKSSDATYVWPGDSNEGKSDGGV